MYLHYWELQKPPFENVPSESQFFRSPQHAEAFSRLLYVIEHHKGVAMLTGEVGSGKSTVAKALMGQLDRKRYEFRILSNPALNPVEFIKAVLIVFGVKEENGSKPEMLETLHQRLVYNAEQAISTVLAIDEAHVIDNQQTLDEIRMLLNFQSDEQFLISLILLGQPPLIKHISELQPLKERISVKYELEPLDRLNTRRYIEFRLKRSGAARELFSEESLGSVYEYSGGIPLRINKVCDRALLVGYMRKAADISSEIVAAAVEDLQ